MFAAALMRRNAYNPLIPSCLGIKFAVNLSAALSGGEILCHD